MSLDFIPENDENEDIVIDNELAVGLKVPTSVKVPTGYLSGLRKYKDIYNDIYKQMEVCSKLYRYNAIIGNAVDILIDFSVTQVRPLPTGSKKLDKILEYWFDHLNDENSNTMMGVYPLMQEICLEWFTSGNAFPYKKWDNVKIDDIKGVFKLPMSINLINPQSITIPNGPIAFGQEVIYLNYDSELLEKIGRDSKNDPEAALIRQAVPKSILNSMKSSRKLSGSSEGIRLNPKYISHLKRRAKGYQAWGVPYLSRSFSSVSLLERLRELDDSITSGLMNLITVFKIGTEEHPASNSRLKAFARLINNPKATQTLVWAHDVDILQVGPDGKVLQFSGKYKEAKEDTLAGLGIPPVLMSLDQKSADEWVSILSLVERLSHWRNTISLWLEKTCNEIAKYNGIKAEVKIKWNRMNLVDEQSVKNLILAFYDRGLISIDTSLKEAGYNKDRELVAKKSEQEELDLFRPPSLPFSGDKQEVDKGRPIEEDPMILTKEKKKDNTKIENTIDLKEQKKKSRPKRKT